VIRILAVHGVGNLRPGVSPQVAEEALASSWQRYLDRGPLRSLGVDYEVYAAYYAPCLSQPGQQSGLARLEDLDALAQEMVLEWAMAQGMSALGAQGRGTAPVRSAVSWVAQRRGLPESAVRTFVAVFFREVEVYLGRSPDSPQRSAAREVVVRAVQAHHPDVVLAHSLGSVVAYEALNCLPENSTGLWVTIGSPLALPGAIYPRLDLVDRAQHSRPAGTARWVNLADPGDLVAIPRRGIPLYFTGVDADVEASIDWLEFHQAEKYLSCPAFADLIKQYAVFR